MIKQLIVHNCNKDIHIPKQEVMTLNNAKYKHLTYIVSGGDPFCQLLLFVVNVSKPNHFFINQVLKNCSTHFKVTRLLVETFKCRPMKWKLFREP